MNNRIPIDDHDQPEVTSTSAVLSAGFRPFFIFAGLSGVVPVLAWVLAYTGNGSTPGDFSPAYWHGHEMIFGFVIAAASGFLLTAVPNWTRSGPFSGWQLGLLVLIWLAGRLAMWFGEPAGSPFVAVIDLTMI
ncbi:MAG: NnrS family protein, partial [Rhodospirillales bacterium]|nr:NnrS family protein [Rhodospirillales bacterium]